MHGARGSLTRSALDLGLWLTATVALTAAGTLWPARAADPTLPEQAADPALVELAPDPVLLEQAAAPILLDQAAPVLLEEAATPVLLAQAAESSLPAQAAEPVLPAQALDPVIPPQTPDPALLAQALDAVLPAQAAEPSLPAQAPEPAHLAKAAEPSLPAQAADPPAPAHVAPPAQAARPDPDPEGRREEIWMAVNDGKLDTLRGGFDPGNGLLVSFGITRAVYINGNLVTQTTLDFSHLNDLTAAQAAQLSKQLASLNIVQNGPGNTVQAQQGGVNFGTIIQNSLSNQHIENQTIINASSNSMGTLKNLNSLSTLNDSLLSAVGAR